MCKKSSSADALPSAASRRSTTTNLTSSSSSSGTGPRNTAAANISSSSTTTAASSSSRSSGRSSLAAARASLPDPPVLYSFQELAAATNSFLAKRASDLDSTYPYWRCVLRARHAALFQLRSAPGLTKAAASAALARVARYHHTGLAPLLGACLAGPHVYLAYELPDPSAATLAACLRSSNPAAGFTVLRTWLSRVQIAADVAQGLDYVHNHAAQVHGRVSPSAVLVSDPSLRARLTHFGASQFAAAESGSSADAPAPPSREADVYAFGVLLLGLLSGEAAAARHRFDRATGEFVRVTVVETAAEAARSGRVRGWVDRRLGDSFPVAAAERLVEVGVRCAAGAEADRPDMSWAAGKVSKAYVDSIAWEHSLRPPTK